MSRATITAPALLTDCTCLRVRKAARRVSMIYDECLEPFGLTITQYGLLAHIRRLDGVGIGTLAEVLVMDPTTLTRNVRPLVRRGLVIYVADPNDKRARVLHLSSEGQAALDNARPGWAQAQQRIAEALGADDSRQLALVIDRLLERVAE